MSAAITLSAPARPVDGVVTLPGSKSYTNRALVVAALANGATTIRSALFSEDTFHMADSLRRLGIAVHEDPAAETFVVEGRGGVIPAHQVELFVGNSGTTARFLLGLLTLGQGRYLLDGVPRMRERPIQPLLDALVQLGGDAASVNGTGCPPVHVAANGLLGGVATMAGNQSSQYFSALLLVGAYARRGVDVEVVGDLVSKPYIDMTAATLRAFGVAMENDGYRRFRVAAGQRYVARDYAVEPDASAACYFLAAAAILGGRVRLAHLGADSVQGDARFADVLEAMGCAVVRSADSLEVRGTGALAGVDVDLGAMSDQVPTLAAIAPFATSPVTIRNVAHVRLKETDRLAAVATELRRLGVRVDEQPDGLVIFPSALRPARVETYDDHRMAMSFALIGLRVPGVEIANPACVAKTFPDYFERLAAFTGADACFAF
ncbi:MAG: 3-phosphoshikimate 1-carboxyvinyltransferase [Chloroflexi bacterium]|nr:3-phosphoshikimate 1-carboxyvinyltransferase [Chloroflexota bacterium]